MPDLVKLLSNWKKEIAFLVILSTLTVGVVVFLLPAKYLATSTALAANPAVTDKATVFNNSLQELYSALGTPDDVDKMVGTAQLDTVYLATARKFDLATHYQVKEKGEAAVDKAALLLKKESRVTKTEYGELQVRVWDKDKKIVADLANNIMQEIATIHQNLQSENNKAVIQSLTQSQQRIRISLDSNGVASPSTQQRVILVEQLTDYEKLKAQYQLMVDANPAALVMVEKARPANWPDKPKRIPILIAGFVLSVIFSILLALLMEQFKKKA